ncbi:hypothetical protein GP486_005478 [Trichoglossum hirsutum]|uniref:Cation chloride cotransporter n=1 Tax=Trichoglossum hirsutum TaxID=265104 RepID=A0A9P8RM70_9PEZI|nr:hypothetical protein GP486_005478 [Trichoglossum hirsutum]
MMPPPSSGVPPSATPPAPSGQPKKPYEPHASDSPAAPRDYAFTRKVFGKLAGGGELNPGNPFQRDRRRGSRSSMTVVDPTSLISQLRSEIETKAQAIAAGARPGAMPRPVGGQEKLGTFSGVFVPTSLNVLSILMFLRFGLILGQSGFLGMMIMLIASYLINLVTTLSISAIATNGTVRGGGAYYLISRSLGPEFGGSIGIVLYLGFVFNTGMNAVGLIDCFAQNFGKKSGSWSNFMPEGFWWQYLFATVVLVVCTGICLAGSGIFARASNGLLAILLVATFSIPLSAFMTAPFEDRKLGVEYTGISMDTFKGNFWPGFTRGAAGSQLQGKENYQDLFGILFPATGGIFAGASMSGDLKHPSKAIPKGTLGGLALTFFAYAIVILAMALTIARPSFYRDVNVIQDTNVSVGLVLLGEFATTFFSSLMGVIGSAKLLQAIGRDHLLPGFSIFGQGSAGADEPTYAILFTYLVAQLTMLCDINQIASFVTMTYLMTFLVTNLACFLLKISSAPNFRPSFHYFNRWTALAGTVVSGATMFFVDGLYATGCVGILIFIFLLIHYTSPPKSWGDVSQSLIYHQVRKYLLRLKQEHVKFWRPQILLFVNDPRRQYKLIQFCNSLKKGALYILGHVIVAQDFGEALPEARRQQTAWAKYIDFSKVKAFVNIAISPTVEWGARNLVLSAGLGGMRPNIAIVGSYNLDEFRRNQPLVDVPPPPRWTATSIGDGSPGRRPKPTRKWSKDDKLKGVLPTDTCRTEGATSAKSYVTILEDLLLRLQINVAVAKGFHELELPNEREGDNAKKYIDLWPIQMSAEIITDGDHNANVLTTNFDTYTLILQLGCILSTVPSWKKNYRVRVAVFVEYEADVEEERGRVKSLLDNLRIEAEILVFWLASGDLKTYEVIVNGTDPGNFSEGEEDIDNTLKDEEWWQEVRRLRGQRGPATAAEELAAIAGHVDGTVAWHEPSWSKDGISSKFEGLKELLSQPKRRHTMSGLSKLGLSMGMRTHRLHPQLMKAHASNGSASEESESDSDAPTSDDEESSGEDGRLSAASENDIDDLGFEDEDDHVPDIKPSLQQVMRRRSIGGSLGDPKVSKRPSLRHASHHKSSSSASIPPPSPQGISPAAPDLTTADRPPKMGPRPATPSSSGSQVQQKPQHQSTPAVPVHKPSLTRHSSIPKFTSTPVPRTTIACENESGPSIMFTNTPSPPRGQQQRMPSTRSEGGSNIVSNRQQEDDKDLGHPQPATGFPAQQAVPLSFNDLPCRAQHLILNELIQANSLDTAVVFTTLPSPLEGTCYSEEESVAYLNDLEVLCQGLPPVLLVHSNSMTVTTNL